MQKPIVVPLLLAGALVLPAAAQMAPNATTEMKSEPGKVHVTQTVDLSAKVVAIDKAERVVTLRGPKGNEVDIVAGPEVKNFAQINVGDTVVAHYVESVYLELKTTNSGMRQGAETKAAGRAKLGERPAGAMVREVTVLADVTAVDPAKQTVTLKGPKNNVVEVPVRDPAQFKLVKVGDQVEATYTQAMAIAVEATPAAMK